MVPPPFLLDHAMRSQVWNTPAPLSPADLFRFCARRALAAHKAGQSSAARFWFERAEIFAERAK